MIEKVTYTQPYGSDNVLNAFGDYDRLRYTATRENGGPISRKWELVSSRGAPDLELTTEQTHNALECQFVMNAVRETNVA
jgi:hypothetical protein